MTHSVDTGRLSISYCGFIASKSANFIFTILGSNWHHQYKDGLVDWKWFLYILNALEGTRQRSNKSEYALGSQFPRIKFDLWENQTQIKLLWYELHDFRSHAVTRYCVSSTPIPSRMLIEYVNLLTINIKKKFRKSAFSCWSWNEADCKSSLGCKQIRLENDRIRTTTDNLNILSSATCSIVSGVTLYLLNVVVLEIHIPCAGSESLQRPTQIQKAVRVKCTNRGHDEKINCTNYNSPQQSSS